MCPTLQVHIKSQEILNKEEKKHVKENRINSYGDFGRESYLLYSQHCKYDADESRSGSAGTGSRTGNRIRGNPAGYRFHGNRAR